MKSERRQGGLSRRRLCVCVGGGGAGEGTEPGTSSPRPEGLPGN